MSSLLCNDGSFGPVAQGCPGRTFDFTKTFQGIFLSLIPNALFLTLVFVRVGCLVQRTRVMGGLSFQLLKLGLLMAFFSLNLTRAIALTVIYNGPIPQLTTARVVLSILGATAMIPLSFLEHARSRRPSDLLTIFLVLTILFDIVLTRTAWLASSRTWEVADASIQTAALALKSIILVAECQRKDKWIMRWCKDDHSPEETSSLFSLAFFSWLNPLFVQGYREHLSVDTLYAIDRRLQASHMFSRISRRLDQISFRGRRLGLARALAKEFTVPFLLPAIPRLAMIGFTFCQPFFINALVSNIAARNSVSVVNNGYGLIGACILIYGGIALSTSLYSYYSWRALYMIRASLVSAVYQKTLDTEPNKLADGATVTLMSTDIERMMAAWMDIHSVWASLIEIALGCYLLHSHLGMAFLSPIIVILVCFSGMACVGAKAGPRQAAWMEKIENRVSMITTLLGNIKACKISGMAPGFAHIIQGARDDEIRVGNRFRWLQVIAATLAYAPVCLSPVIAFAFAGRNLDVTGFFTSLSFLTLVTSPLTLVFQQIPGVIAGFTCLARIQEFLEGDIRRDTRISSGVQGQIQHSLCPALISVVNGDFGWVPESPVLRSISAVVPQGQLTLVVGPVACGKSTLCKAILGEVPHSEGKVQFAFPIPSIGYCDQTPFLSNLSIRENITAFSPFDPEKYHEVISATALGPDIALLPEGHDTIVGSSGGMLSGGQKQRVSLARALYQEAPLLLMDDTLTGLDQGTEAEVFHRVFGFDGVIRRRGSTAVLFTSSERYLAAADHVIHIEKDGRVSDNANDGGLFEKKEYHDGLEHGDTYSVSKSGGTELSLKKHSTDVVIKEVADQEAPDSAYRVRDLDVYKHYFGTIRISILGVFALSCVLFGFGNSFPTVWISFWASNTYNAPNAFYAGLYSTLRVLQLLGFFFAALLALGPMVSDAGSKLHSNALRTVIRAPLRFFTNTDTGAITSLFSQDITIIDSELPDQLFNISAGVCGLIGTACVIAVASPWLALVYPILVVVFWIVQRVYLRTSKQLRILDLEAKSPLYANFLETTQGISTIRAFGWSTQKLEHNHHLLDQSQRPAYLLSMIQLWLLLTANIVATGVATAMTILTTQLRANPGFTGASAVTLMTFSGLVTILIRDYTAFETSLGAVSRLKGLSDNVKVEDRDGGDIYPDEQWPREGSVEIQGLSASYDDIPPSDSSVEKVPNLVLKDITLSVSSGEKMAICGRTGSGKSSLVLLLLRLLDPIPKPFTTFTIDGIPIQRLDRSILRERIIGVPQDAVFLPNGNTIKDNLDPSDLATEDECLSVLETVHLSALVDNTPQGLYAPLTANHLSGGEKKLFSLGRAILRRVVRDRASLDGAAHGGILILDEVSSGVDAITATTMHEIIAREFANYTVVAVVHGLDIVAQFFDRVVVMEEGAMVESGSPRELLQNPGSWFKRLLLMDRTAVVHS